MKRVSPLIVPMAGAFGQGREREMSPILWGVMVGWGRIMGLCLKITIVSSICTYCEREISEKNHTVKSPEISPNIN